jgi:hypothetical protein
MIAGLKLEHNKMIMALPSLDDEEVDETGERRVRAWRVCGHLFEVLCLTVFSGIA